jgi:hypothetical protein
MEKKDIALQQLIDAAKLYNKGRYVSAITLAGASEEILGKISKKRVGSNQLKYEIEYIKSIYKHFNRPCPSNSDLIEQINKTKNEVKHNDVGENLWVEADFENEFVIIFMRAVKNYFNVYNEIPKDKTTMNLFEHLAL